MLAFIRRRHAAILMLLVATNLLWSAFAFRGIAVGWDESVYVGMGRYLFTGGREGLFEPIRPPGWPILLGAVEWAAHLDAAVAGRFLVGALLVGCLLFMRDALRNHVDDGLITVFSAAVFLAPQLLGCRVALLTHVPAAFFALFGLYQYKRGRYFWAGACAGAAFAIRFTFVLFVAAAVVVAVVDAFRSRRARSFVALCVGIAVPACLVLAFNVATNIHEVGFWQATIRPLVLGSAEQSNGAWAREGMFANLLFYVRALAAWTGVLMLALIALWPPVFRRTPAPVRIAVASFSGMLAYYTWAANKQERFVLDFVFFAGLGAAFAAAQLVSRYRVPERAREWLLFGSLGVSASVLLGSLALLEVPAPPGAEAYFAHENGKKILTVSPTFAPYAEQNLFVPLYMRHEPPLDAYRRAAHDADYAVFEPSFFFCTDDACRDQVRRVATEFEKGALVALLPLRDKTARVYRLR